MFKILDKTSPRIMFTANFFLVLILGFLDYITGNEWSFHVFYFLPISLVSWYLGWKIGLGFVFFIIGVWSWAQILSGLTYSSDYIFAWNMTVRFAVFLIINKLIASLKENTLIIHKNNLKQQKEKVIMETSQKMVGVIAEYISARNSEILTWVSIRKNSGNKVPLVVESASQAIGNCLRALTEIFYTDLFLQKKGIEKDYVKHLQEKLNELRGKYSGKKE